MVKRCPTLCSALPVVIRSATLQDAAAIRDIYAPFVEQTAASFEADVPTLADMRARVQKGLDGYSYLVAERSGQVVGYAYGSQYRPRHAYRFTAEVSVYVAMDAGGQGIGRALYTQLLSDLAKQGFQTAVGVVTTPNPASDSLHLALGFTLVGTLENVGQKFGNWYGTSFYQRMLQDAAR